MAIYQISGDSFDAVPQTTFAAVSISERNDLQRLLRDRIGIIAADTLVIAEEFCYWDDSRRRIDLLAIDKDANLVVIELKRTEDGGHMELQAIRYAAMISTLTFSKAIDIFADYLDRRGDDRDAETVLLEFLDWEEEPDEDAFATDTRIVLVSAEFSKELTTAVLWLTEHEIDIRCVRMRPYNDGGKILVDVQQVIPLPEAEDYQVRVREKKQRERTVRRSHRDLTKFTVTIDEKCYERLPKRRAILAVVKGLCDEGISPSDMETKLDWRRTLFCSAQGELGTEDFVSVLQDQQAGQFDPKRWFTGEEELIHFDSCTYTLTNQWGTHTAKAMGLLLEHFKPQRVSFEKSD